MSRDMDGFTRYYGYYDMDGVPVKRTPQSHPYAYDMFVIHRAAGYYTATTKDVTKSFYSDRILQWDFDKTRKLMKKHFGEAGDSYRSRDPKKIQSFLRERFNEPDLKLLAVMEGCNVSNGYPVYWFGCK